MPAAWKPAKRRQKDLDAAWPRKHGQCHHGYKLYGRLAPEVGRIAAAHGGPEQESGEAARKSRSLSRNWSRTRSVESPGGWIHWKSWVIRGAQDFS